MSDPIDIFDRRLVRRRRARAAATQADVLPLYAEVADRLLDRLDDTTRTFHHALDIGGRGVIAPRLRARGIHVVSTDLAPTLAASAGGHPVAADEEFLPFAPASFDLVVANLSLHWINDLPGALLQIRRAMAPDGLFLASLPALGTLAELRAALTEAEAELTGGATPRVSPFTDLRDAAGLLQRAGFTLPVADGDSIELAYADPFALLRDLRAAGETNATRLRGHATPPRALFPLALSSLPQRPDGRRPTTLRLAMLTGWSPSPTQPRPAPRGSGTVNLADALRNDD